MDEPAAGLDPLFRKELMGYMQEIVEDGTRSILFSTHITEDLDQIGDYILLMDYGISDCDVHDSVLSVTVFERLPNARQERNDLP